MKYRKLFLLGMLIIPWLSIPFLGRGSIRKYLQTSIFITVFTKLLDLYGEKNRWWRFYKGIHLFDSMDFLNLGPFFASSLWMLKLTYGKFFTYLISNTILHIVFIYAGLTYLKKLKVLALVKLSKPRYLVLHFFRGLLLYLFQYLKDKLTTKKRTNHSDPSVQ
jgi:hypothetical protein